ncbi:MAG TPA: hypothetical protein VK447_12185 [Myxococcaceae bacterium]|nr:hypothetical protein [Myxococcaceae bacterium]
MGSDGAVKRAAAVMGLALAACAPEVTLSPAEVLGDRFSPRVAFFFAAPEGAQRVEVWLTDRTDACAVLQKEPDAQLKDMRGLSLVLRNVVRAPEGYLTTAPILEGRYPFGDLLNEGLVLDGAGYWATGGLCGYFRRGQASAGELTLSHYAQGQTAEGAFELDFAGRTVRGTFLARHCATEPRPHPKSPCR